MPKLLKGMQRSVNVELVKPRARTLVVYRGGRRS